LLVQVRKRAEKIQIIASMKNILQLSICTGMVLWLISCTPNPRFATHCFPGVSVPEAITSGPKEHLFASYYGINSWSSNQRYATVLETEIRDTIPTEYDAAVLGLVDMVTKKYIPVTTTHAWNFQQGCMAHWLGTSPDSLIIYNDLVDDKFVALIMNVHTRKLVKTIPYPISAVSPDGKTAIGINFSRLRITRSDYGYGGNGQDPLHEIPFPEEVEVITGGARGADASGARWAAAYRHKSTVMQAEWDKYGKRAGYIRNVAMADYGPKAAIIFWDGESKGTKMMVDILAKRNIPYITLSQ
jgi:hypothetical protein